MTRDDRLLEAVVERPDDDAPRLAYADWLEGRGDPRGEFIRVQIDLDHLPPDDPRRESLGQREREILDEHAREWAEPLRHLITEWTYRRGFIERVETSLEVPASTILELLRLAPIRHIRDPGQFCDLDGVVEALPRLRHLTGLEFWGLYAFDDERMRTILQSHHLAGLQTLILHHDRNGNLVDDEVILRWLLPLRDHQGYLPGMEPPPREATLRELAVNVDGSWRGPSAAIVRAMAQSPLLGRLRKLDLSHSHLDLETVEELGRSRYLTHLEELDLGGCNLMGEVWDALLRLPQVSRLRWLRLHGAIQTDSPGDHMEELSRIPRYREAFEQAVAQVDWETQFIHPWSGGCWKGFSWKERERATSPEPPRNGTRTTVTTSGEPGDPAGWAGGTTLYELLTRPLDSYEDAETFLADMKTLEEAARVGRPADPRLTEAAIGAARGYKRMAGFSVNGRSRAGVVVESVLPALGPAIVPELLKGYDPTNSWDAAGRLAALCRIDPVLGRRLCYQALLVADRYLQEVILDGLFAIAPTEVESVALGFLDSGFGKLGPFDEHGFHVSRALKRLGSLSESTIAHLMKALDHPNPGVRDAAASVLRELGPEARAAVPALHAMLRAPDTQSYTALEALTAIDPKGEADVPELVAGLADGYYFYRFAMVRWLRYLGPEAHAAVPALTAALNDEHHFVRSEAAAALGAIGSAARSAVPALVAALGDEGHNVGQSAAEALAEIGKANDAACAALVGALDGSRHEVRCRVIEALRKCEGEFDRFIPSLVALIDDPEMRVRYAALAVLLERPLPTPYAIRVCRVALGVENAHLRRSAAAMLARLSPEARSAVTGRPS